MTQEAWVRMQAAANVRRAVTTLGLKAVLTEIRDLCRQRSEKLLDVFDYVADDLDATIDGMPRWEKDGGDCA